jgi:AcrR family transcriptional regulator
MVVSNERFAALLDMLADHVLSEGLSASSLRPLAKAAQTSDRMLLYYFNDKAAVMYAVIEHVMLRLVAVMEAQKTAKLLPLDLLQKELSAIVCADILWPYMRLWLEIASLAARGDSFYRAVGEQIARRFLEWGSAQLDSPNAEQHRTDAAKLLVTIEGMVVLKSVGLDDVLNRAV